MIRRAVLAAIAVGALAERAAAQAPPAGQYVDLAPVAMPIVVDGRLLNYVFVYVRINLTPQADMPKWRDKEPYFRDALVKLGHRTPFTRYDDYTKLDEARLKVALYQAAAAIAGPDQIAGVQILPAAGRCGARGCRNRNSRRIRIGAFAAACCAGRSVLAVSADL